MPLQFQLIAPYIGMAASVGVVAGIVAFFWVPGLKTRNAVQHFAAGVVLGAVTSDLMPEVERAGKPVGILLGFAAGGVAMIFLKWLVVKFEKKEAQRSQLPLGLAVAAGVDTFIDGAIISAGFTNGQQLGSLLTAALAVELFFLNLSVGSEFHKLKSKRWVGVVATTAIALLLAIGAFGGMVLFHGMSQTSVAIVLSFGAAALIYLIAEELLVESIEGETIFSVVMLFLGLLVVLAFKLLGQNHVST